MGLTLTWSQNTRHIRPQCKGTCFYTKHTMPSLFEYQTQSTGMLGRYVTMFSMYLVSSYRTHYQVFQTAQNTFHFTSWQTGSFKHHFNFSGKHSAMPVYFCVLKSLYKTCTWCPSSSRVPLGLPKSCMFTFCLCLPCWQTVLDMLANSTCVFETAQFWRPAMNQG